MKQKSKYTTLEQLQNDPDLKNEIFDLANQVNQKFVSDLSLMTNFKPTQIIGKLVRLPNKMGKIKD